MWYRYDTINSLESCNGFNRSRESQPRQKLSLAKFSYVLCCKLYLLFSQKIPSRDALPVVTNATVYRFSSLKKKLGLWFSVSVECGSNRINVC